MARELGIDLNDVRSTDPLGRVRPHDVQAHAAAPKRSTSCSKKVQLLLQLQKLNSKNQLSA